MRSASRLSLLWAVLAAGGCAGPAVTVRHVLPAALPLPADVASIHVGEFAVRGQAPEGLADSLAAALKKALADAPWRAEARAGAPRPTARVEVAGEVRAESAETRGSRLLRPGRQDQPERAVPTLRRTASVRVTFALTRADGGEPLGAAEVRRTYDSAEDPRTRGPLGLGRPDDPDAVPPAGQVLRELLAECAEAFARMVSPAVVEARVPLRAAGGEAAERGLKAAAAEDWRAAAGHFQAALDAAGEDANLLFNLAAVREALGELDASEADYRAALRLRGGDDAEAAAGAARVAQVRGRL